MRRRKIVCFLLAVSIGLCTGGMQVHAAELQEAELPVESETVNSIMPLYFQTDYPYTLYGEGTVATNGCGITCLAMVASYLTGHTYYPDELAGYFGGKAENNIKRLEYAAEQLQLSYYKAENWHKTMEALRDGKVAIALMHGPSLFTDKQHFIVLTGLNSSGKIMVHDPNADNYAKWELKNAFENGFDAGDILYGYSGAWIFDKNAMPEEPFVYSEEEPHAETRYSEIQLTWDEWDLLARMIWVEARGESFEGQQAIAEIVFNRMQSNQFPDALTDVVYAEGQFNSTPFLEDAEPTQTQYEAIQCALEGPNVLAEDVVYFGREAENENVWGKIGGHIFCYQGAAQETVAPEEVPPIEAIGPRESS